MIFDRRAVAGAGIDDDASSGTANPGVIAAVLPDDPPALAIGHRSLLKSTASRLLFKALFFILPVR